MFGVALSLSRASRCSPRAPTACRPALALVTLVVYLVIYTPMKRRTPLATLVGAVPGALPPLIGWTASHGSDRRRRRDAVRDRVPLADPALHGDRVDVPRRLRASAGFPMLPVIEPEGRRAGRQAVVVRRGASAGQPGADAGRHRGAGLLRRGAAS